MFSFSSLAVFATVAFSALSSAIPLNPVDALPLPDLPLGALPDTSAVTGVLNGLPAGGLPVVGGLVGRQAPPGVAVILATTQDKIGLFTGQLKYVTTQNVTVDAVSAPIGEIKAILTETIGSLQLLIGQPVEVIFASVEGTALITVQELGKIVAGLVCIVFEALGAVITVAGHTIDKVVFDLLVTVGVLVGTLLTTVFALVGTTVGDLLAVVVPLLKTVIPFIIHLNIATVISLLHL